MDRTLHFPPAPATSPVATHALRLSVPLPRGVADTLGQVLCRAVPASVRRCRHGVADLPAVHGQDRQRLTLHLETDRSQSPRAALAEAAHRLQAQLAPFADAGRPLQPVHVIPGPDPVLGVPLGQLGLGQRGLNALHARGLATVGDLLACTAADLLRAPNFGRRCLLEVQQALADRGLVLGELARPGRGDWRR